MSLRYSLKVLYLDIYSQKLSKVLLFSYIWSKILLLDTFNEYLRLVFELSITKFCCRFGVCKGTFRYSLKVLYLDIYSQKLSKILLFSYLWSNILLLDTFNEYLRLLFELSIAKFCCRFGVCKVTLNDEAAHPITVPHHPHWPISGRRRLRRLCTGPTWNQSIDK